MTKMSDLLRRILTPTPCERRTFKKRPVMYQDAYLKALEKNNTELGIPFVRPELPVYDPPPPPKKSDEPDLPFLDRVYVNFRILKSGIVRIKIVPNFLILYEEYYKRAARPPMKLILQAYKARGFSGEFIEKVKRDEQKRLQFAKKVPGILDKIFEKKEPVKKVKKERLPAPTPTPEEELPEEDEPENDDEEDGAMDVEPEEEPEEEEVVYSSDED